MLFSKDKKNRVDEELFERCTLDEVEKIVYFSVANRIICLKVQS
ncbi:hypothetical protein [Desulfosporosinus sp.]|nr:hypothetical protein [Desulfosporosinus sp.]